MSEQYRQGDVFLRRVAEVTDPLIPVPRDGDAAVLAYGEVTGHRHAVLERHAELLADPDTTDEPRFLRVEEQPAFLVHEEHDTITLAPGWYEVIRQREYEPDERANRNVAD